MIRTTWERDLAGHVDRHGNITVEVTIGRAGAGAEPRETGANAQPATVARFLRELADDVDAIDGPRRSVDEPEAAS